MVNRTIILLVGIPLIALIIFLVYRNLKDKKELEEKIKQDYRKPRDDEGDIEIDEVMK